MEVSMSLVVIVPLLPLVTAVIILVGEPQTQYRRAQLAVLPLVAAFVGALITLFIVVSEGAIAVRFYDPSSIANLALPLGFYIDRLSAVMMALILAVGTIVYRYSVNYMYEDRFYRRFMALIGLTTFVLLCMVSSANLDYVVYLLAAPKLPAVLAGP